MKCIQCDAPVPADSPWPDACGEKCSHARMREIVAWALSVGGLKQASALLRGMKR